MLATLLLFIAASAALAAAQAQEPAICFSDTGACVDERFREFWQRNGEVAHFGKPIAPRQTRLVNGKESTFQDTVGKPLDRKLSAMISFWKRRCTVSRV